MGKPTGPTNPAVRGLLNRLNEVAKEKGAPIWAAVAGKLSTPARRKSAVNIGKLEAVCDKGDVVLVPGKLLAEGELTKALKVAALQTSQAARQKVEAAGGQVLSIDELVTANPNGKGVKIIL